MKYCSVIKNFDWSKNFAICNNIDRLEIIQTEKDKRCISLIYGIYKIKQSSEYRKRETDSWIQVISMVLMERGKREEVIQG